MGIITRKDLLTPYAKFEQQHNIKGIKNDIPKKFLGINPSKYYKFIDMNTEKLAAKVDKLLKKLYKVSL
jgi:hypothetical protein